MTSKDALALYKRAGLPAPPGIAQPDASKYNARKKAVDGHVFDSTSEANAYQVLKSWEQAGHISALKLQPSFVLQDKFKDTSGVTQRAIRYIADFQFQRDGKTVVADVKGVETQLFRNKAKMFRLRYPWIVFEVWNKDEVRRMMGK